MNICRCQRKHYSELEFNVSAFHVILLAIFGSRCEMSSDVGNLGRHWMRPVVQ